MAYLGNQPLLSTMRTVAEGTAYANQTEIPVPGGLVSGMVDVIVNGSDLGSADYDDTNGASIKLYVPMPVGSYYKVVAWTPNQTVVNAGGQLAPFRNKLINGNFDIWQRGTSLAAGTGSPILADRWNNASGGTTMAPSRQAFSLGQTDVPGEPAYFHRVVVASAAGAGNYAQLVYRLEGVRSLAGQQATISFYAKADSTKTIAVSANQSFGTGGSPSSAVVGIKPTQNQFTLTTNWQKFKGVFTFPSIAGKTLGNNGDDLVQLNFWFDAGSNYNSDTGSLGQQSGTFDIARVQLEAGGVATDFEARPIGLELTLCQRYFWSSYPDSYYPGQANATAGVIAGRQPTYGSDNYTMFGRVSFPVRMRAIPTTTIYHPKNGTSGQASLTNDAVLAAAANWAGPTGCSLQISNNTVGAGSDIICHVTASAEL